MTIAGARPDTLEVLRKLFGRPAATDDPIETTFGVLEREVLDVLWASESGHLAVRDVQEWLGRPIAYTTVMTTLDRLFKKGVLHRHQAGRAFLYAPARGRDELRAEIAATVLASLLASREGTAPVLSNLVDSVGASEGGDDLLRALERLVRDKRRELRRRPSRPGPSQA